MKSYIFQDFVVGRCRCQRFLCPAGAALRFAAAGSFRANGFKFFRSTYVKIFLLDAMVWPLVPFVCSSAF